MTKSKSTQLVRTARLLALPLVTLVTMTFPARAQADAPSLDSGDTAWMLTATALVLMMTIPGIMLFYGGVVRKKNVLATMMQSFAVCCLASVLWMIAGYSFAFAEGNAFLGGFDRMFLSGMGLEQLSGTVPESSEFRRLDRNQPGISQLTGTARPEVRPMARDEE